MTRPPRPHRLSVRVTGEEEELITTRAAECGLTVSAFFRQAALGSPPRERTLWASSGTPCTSSSAACPSWSASKAIRSSCPRPSSEKPSPCFTA